MGGTAFADVVRGTHANVLEGDVVRILMRLEEVAKEVRAAARILGDASLAARVDALLGGLKRGIISTQSLYTDGSMEAEAALL